MTLKEPGCMDAWARNVKYIIARVSTALHCISSLVCSQHPTLILCHAMSTVYRVSLSCEGAKSKWFYLCFLSISFIYLGLQSIICSYLLLTNVQCALKSTQQNHVTVLLNVSTGTCLDKQLKQMYR